jgi:O-antigen/teichoic acid export membrane protein
MLTALARSEDEPNAAVRSAVVVRPLSLKSNFAWTLGGNVVYSACQWGMLVLLAKLSTPATVGEFALALAVVAPLVTFACFNLRVVQATDARREHDFGDYLRLRLMALTVAILVIVAIAYSTNQESSSRAVILIIAFAKALEAVSDVVFGLLQQHERMDRIGLSLAIKGAAQLGVIWVVLSLTGNLVWGVVGLGAVNLLMLFSYDLPSVSRVFQHLGPGRHSWEQELCSTRAGSLRAVRSLALLAWPLGVVGMLDSLNTNVPRYFIEHLQGKVALGYFSALAYIMVAGQTVISALADAARPRLARLFIHDLLEFKSLLYKLLALGSLIGLAGIATAVVAGRPILRILYRGDYADHADILTVLMIAAAIWYLSGFVYTALTACRMFRIQVVLFAVSLMSTTIACAILIPSFGLAGAAWSLCAGMLTRLLILSLILFRAVRKHEVGVCRLVLEQN